MKLESMDITEVLKPLPERLMWHFSHLYMSHPAKILTEFKFYKGVEHGRTVVVCEYKDERYVGVAVKSAQDKMDESVGLTIALCRCLRSAGLLPKEHKQARKRQILSQNLNPFTQTKSDQLIRRAMLEAYIEAYDDWFGK